MRLKRWLAVAVAAMLPVCASAYSRVVVFGDSLSDGGNNALLLGTDPGQVITGNTYMAGLPYGSGTYSDGAVWVSFFADGLGLSAGPSLAGGTNYAYGGALTRGEASVSLLKQVGQYLQTGAPDAGDTLFVLAGGGNNARTALESIAAGAPALRTMAEASRQYAQDVGRMVDALQAVGAQDIVVWNTPDVGFAPVVRAQGDLAMQLGIALSGRMNSALADRLDGEAHVRTFDIASLLDSAVANPSAYGLVNVTDACGAFPATCDPATALFWDGIHTTSAANKLIAERMLQFTTPAVPEPGAAWLLAGGLALLAVRRRRAAG